MMMNDHVEIKGLFEFLKASPTAFHAVDALCGLLKEQGFAPVQFAKKAGIDPKELQVWIHSHSVPRIDRLIFFCKALNVKPEQLLEGLL